MEDYGYSQIPKNKLFFDIETIPAHESLRDTVTNFYLQKETKNGKTPKRTKTLDEKLYRTSSMSGDFGRIFCIGYAKNDENTQILKGDEKDILKNWWEVADYADLFIGHNIMEFDLRFIFKRSIVNGIKPCARHLNLSFARYRSSPIFDTMREWEKWSSTFIKLDTLAKILGLKSSKDGGIDGSQVWDYYLKNDFEKIYEYCKKDVDLTRLIYKKMVFS